MSHSANIFFPIFREQLIKKIGKLVWKIIVSLIALAGLILMVTHYEEAKNVSIILWSPQVALIYASYI